MIRRRPAIIRFLRWLNAAGAIGWLMFALAVIGVAAVITMLVLGNGADGEPLLNVQLPTTAPAAEVIL